MEKTKSERPVNFRWILFIINIICLFAFIGCQHEYPPMNEYQVVDYIPIESATYGKLFINGDNLIVLYDTAGNYQFTKIRKYDLTNPNKPTLIDTESLDTAIDCYYYLVSQDSFVFFYEYYQPLQILNLNNLNMVSFDIDNSVYSVAYKNNYLFMSTDSGLIIWDINDLPNFIEVFNENKPDSRWDGRLALLDTILFEWYVSSGAYKFKFWNIEDPLDPQLITSGYHNNYYFPYIGITDQYIIGASSYSIYRFKYDLSDSVILDEFENHSYSVNEFNLSDSLIYLTGYNGISIYKIDNFGEKWVIEPHYYYGSNYILSQRVYNNVIYAFLQRNGIYIYERREL